MVGTDGAAFEGHNPRIARAGWAVATGTGRAAYGPLPLPQQAILPAEAYALLMMLRLFVGVTAVCVDNAECVRGLLRGQTWACASGRPFAHLWRQIWRLLDEHGLTPCEDDRVGGLRVYKVKSHLTAAQKEALTAEERRRVTLNEAADLWAKLGADQVERPDWLARWVNGDLKRTKRVCEFVAAFRVKTSQLKVTTWQKSGLAKKAPPGRKRRPIVRSSAPHALHEVLGKALVCSRCRRFSGRRRASSPCAAGAAQGRRWQHHQAWARGTC